MNGDKIVGYEILTFEAKIYLTVCMVFSATNFEHKKYDIK